MLEDSGPYAPNRLPKYCFRWNEIGKSGPIQLADTPQDDIAEREVKKGYLVSIEPPNHEGTTTFHFTRLPSPLTGNTHTWAVDIERCMYLEFVILYEDVGNFEGLSYSSFFYVG